MHPFRNDAAGVVSPARPFRPGNFCRTDHPVCGASVASQLSTYAAATPPFKEGNLLAQMFFSACVAFSSDEMHRSRCSSMLKTIFGLIGIVMATASWLEAVQQEPLKPVRSAATEQRELLNRYCVVCHNE